MTYSIFSCLLCLSYVFNFRFYTSCHGIFDLIMYSHLQVHVHHQFRVMAFVDILSMILCRLGTVIRVSSLFVSANSSRPFKKQ